MCVVLEFCFLCFYTCFLLWILLFNKFYILFYLFPSPVVVHKLTHFLSVMTGCGGRKYFTLMGL